MLQQYTERMARPFPVAKMAHDQYEAPIFISKFLKKSKRSRVKFTTINNALFAHCQRLQSLEHEIAEVVKKVLAQSIDLFLCFMRERIPEILQYYLFAITSDIEYDEVKKVGKQVKQRKWQQRDEVDKR